MMVDDAGNGGRSNGGRSSGRSSGGPRISVAAPGMGLVRGVSAAPPPQRSFTSVGPAVEGRPYFQWPQQLGRWNGTKFVVSPNCLSTLKLMDTKLREEAAVKSQRIRRLLSKPETLKKNIIPVLVESTEIPPVFDPVVRLLVNVTTPLEELVDAERCSQSKNGRNLLKRLSKTSLEIKKTFLDWRTTQAVVKSIKAKVTKDIENLSLSSAEVTSVCLNLTLIRNLLYVPDGTQCHRFRVSEENLKHWIDIKNKIAWNLIIHGLDGVMILMMNSVHKERWALTIVQIIAFIFKEQNVAILQKQLGECLVLVEENSSAEDDSSKSKSSLTNEDSNGSDEILENEKKRETANDSVRCSGVTAKEIEQANATREKKQESEGGGSSSSSGNQDDSGFSQSDFNSSSPESSNSNGSSSKDSSSFSDRSKGSPQAADSPDSPNDQTSNSVARANGDLKKTNSPHSSSESAMSYSSNGQFSSSGSDNDAADAHTRGHIKHPHHKASSKHRAMHSKDSPSNSDSSMEPDVQNRSLKQRTHSSRKSSSALGRVHKYPCTASVCLDAAKSACRNSASVRDVLWEKKKRLMPRDDSADAPSQEEFSNALAAFTVVFLHSGFSPLVVTLRQLYVNTSERNAYNIGWLIAYFMRLSVAMDLPFHHIRGVLTPDIVGLLVYEAVLSHRNNYESGGYLESDRRNHQCLVKAIRELIACADHFSHKEEALHIIAPIVQMTDLRHSLLYFIRKPMEPRLGILSDSIAANHHLLGLMDWCNRTHDAKLDISKHLSLFANRQVMNRYCEVLRNCRQNGVFVNHCVLTMMRHVAIDLEDPDALLGPKTLCCFVELLNEPQIRLPERFESFMNGMINRYLKLNRHPRSSTAGCNSGQRSPTEHNLNSHSESNMSMDSSSHGSSTSSLHRKNRNYYLDSDVREEDELEMEAERLRSRQSLIDCYQRFSESADPVGSMISYFREKGVHMERDEIMDKLVHLQMGSQQEQMVSNDFNQPLSEMEDSSSSHASNTSFVVEARRSSVYGSDTEVSNSEPPRTEKSLQEVLTKLTKQGRIDDIGWVHKILLELTHIKLMNQYKRPTMSSVLETISMHSHVLERDTPVVDFTCEQSQALQCPNFITLLHEVGLHVSPRKQITAPRELSMQQLVECASKLSLASQDKQNNTM